MKSQLRYFYKIWKKIREEYFPKQKASSKAVYKSLFLMLKFVLAALLVAPVALCDRLLLKSGEPFLFFLSIVLTVAYYFWAANCIKNTKEETLDLSLAPYPANYFEQLLLAFEKEFKRRHIDPDLGLQKLIETLDESIKEVEKFGTDARNVALAILQATVLGSFMTMANEAFELIEVNSRVEVSLTFCFMAAVLAMAIAGLVGGGALSFSSLRSPISLSDMRKFKDDAEYVALLSSSRKKRTKKKHKDRKRHGKR